MANQEQLEILQQGVDVWNKWRGEHLGVHVDLRRADLSGAYLGTADLRRVLLSEANLKDAHLQDANLRNAILFRANLKESNLREANLTGADFSEANLKDAKLIGTIFKNTKLAGSTFLYATVDTTNFSNLDFSEVIGLQDVFHSGPSSISIDTLLYSKGKIPTEFLLGCGLSDADIEYSKLANLELSNDEINKILYKIYDLRATQAVQVSPLFISYSHADGDFVNKLGENLTKRGVRYWRDIHDMKAGRIEKQIDRAIRQNPTVLLILSSNSIRSDWVEHEVRTARDLEKDLGRDVLCPITLDSSWKASRWPKRIIEQIREFNILDFSVWQNDIFFGESFRKLIDGLELFYKG